MARHRSRREQLVFRRRRRRLCRRRRHCRLWCRARTRNIKESFKLKIKNTRKERKKESNARTYLYFPLPRARRAKKSISSTKPQSSSRALVSRVLFSPESSMRARRMQRRPYFLPFFDRVFSSFEVRLVKWRHKTKQKQHTYTKKHSSLPVSVVVVAVVVVVVLVLVLIATSRARARAERERERERGHLHVD